MTKENESENQPTSDPGKKPSISTQRKSLFTDPEKLVAMFRDSGNALARAGFIVNWTEKDLPDGYSGLVVTIVGRKGKGDAFGVTRNQDFTTTISFNGEPLT